MSTTTVERCVDLERYPIDRRTLRGYRELCARIRGELDKTGVSILPGFLAGAALDALADESVALEPFGHHSDVPGTPYLELPDDGWPDGHPRVTWGHTALDAVPYDRFPADSILRTVYGWDVLLEFLSDALGFTVYRYDDPLGGLNLAVMREGDELYWHFDQTDFVVSLAIQSSETGGEFEYAPMIRQPCPGARADASGVDTRPGARADASGVDTRPGARADASGVDASGVDHERYDDVAALLAGKFSGVVTVPMTPGTLMLFEGRHSIHRVTPIGGGVPRYVGLFGYDRNPGTCSSALLREIRYGRVS